MEQIQLRLLFYIVWDIALVLAAIGIWVLLARVVFRRMGVLPATVIRPAWYKWLDGVLVSLTLLVLSIAPVYYGGGYNGGAGWEPFTYGTRMAGNLGKMWGFFCFQSLFEELLFRVIGLGCLAVLFFWLVGFLFAPQDPAKRFRFGGKLWFGAGLVANLVTSIGFASAHSNNPEITTVATVNIALAGLLLGQLYWNHGSPWAAWIVHWFWNAGIATLGLPVSGIGMLSPPMGTGITGARPGLFSGGAFGPEGSVVTMIALIIVWTIVAWLGWKAAVSREIPPKEENEEILEDVGATGFIDEAEDTEFPM